MLSLLVLLLHVNVLVVFLFALKGWILLNTIPLLIFRSHITLSVQYWTFTYQDSNVSFSSFALTHYLYISSAGITRTMQLTIKSSLALAAATLAASVSAHSWVEDISVIASNGTFVGEPGYPRAFAKRAAGVDPDKAMVYLLPPNGRPTGNQILDSDPICMPSQQQPKQSDGSPMLNAAPGDMVALRYQENGHVTLPQNQPGKPSNRGTIYIYGTTQPSPDDKSFPSTRSGMRMVPEATKEGNCSQPSPSTMVNATR